MGEDGELHGAFSRSQSEIPVIIQGYRWRAAQKAMAEKRKVY